ncbi:methionine synthase, vitamin-B12 independent [Saccharata proteae CBS 121410]|uniref:Methionine synthase, vitamin-B12 independent n=1 Tax=Saccharata proteae CBS 121410 TaxID=1314787 RepID=A0A9P4LYS0_9PEZI|nr:methionine synthase, vitamin-B12 independent [Saccharata proteae CBS 121410]
MAPPFRAEQIGSLLRPEKLLRVRGNSSVYGKTFEKSIPEEVKRTTEEAIADVVKKQLDLNIRPITSGEYERHIFYSGFFERLQGFDVKDFVYDDDVWRTNLPTVAQKMRAGEVGTRPVGIANRKIEYTRSPLLGEWEYLRSLLPEEKWRECKLTIPSPTYLHLQLKPGFAYSSQVYEDDNAYFEDLATAYQMELKTLYEAGLRSIQVDDPNLTFFMMNEFRAGCVLDGIGPEDLLDTYINAHNACLSGRPKDMHIGVHLCRGNFMQSVHFASGSYEVIAKKLFEELDYDTFYLEFDTERAGGFEPLRFLPRGKNVVLGLVSTKSAEMEDIAVVKDRVFEAADIIALGQGRESKDVLQDSLAVSPQCGFASLSLGGGIGVDMEIMWKKLSLVRDLARSIWQE